MNSKLIYIVSIAVLTVFMILGVATAATSIRGTEGSINFIRPDTSFSFNSIHFGAWNNDGQGISGLSVIGVTSTGKRVVLNTDFMKQTAVLKNDATTLQVSALGTVVIWSPGIPLTRQLSTMIYTYDKKTGKISVIGNVV